MKMPRGWGGSPPNDDDEARERIIDAAMRCIEQYGPTKTGLSDVATELGITRQTVYRLYASTDDLLIAVAETSVETYLDRLAAHVATITDPAEAVAEGIAFTIERLPRERFLGILLTTGRSEVFLKGVTSKLGIAFSRSMFARMVVDWEAYGFDDEQLDGLAEFALRMLQSFVLDPTPGRSRSDLRAFLRRWVAPAIDSASLKPAP
jgi:AcrR family transcriptional regulator